MLIALLATLLLLRTPNLQPQPEGRVPGPPPSKTPVLDELRDEADALRALVKSDLAKAFLDGVRGLAEPEEIVVYRSKDGRTITTAEFEALPADQKEAFTKRILAPRFYYHTAYGTPLMYARPLDVLAGKLPEEWGGASLRGKRVLDFGFGTIGHLRLLASLGADATGVDVEPLFKALYAGNTEAEGATDRGVARVRIGRWPAAPEIVADVRSRAPYDLLISKNTLKRGYIHPERPADPARLINLGVDDAAFLKAVSDSLAPRGVFFIYNICPAQSLPSEPFIPHADGRCPFDRAALEAAGFEVLAYDEDDQARILEFWQALGMNQGKPKEEMEREIFAQYTLCRKKKDGSGK